MFWRRSKYGLIVSIAVLSIILFQYSSNYYLLDHPVSIASSASLHIESSTSLDNCMDYTWSNVAIQGMGFVTGLVIHPNEPELVYIRTDVGGAYRWNANASRWVQLMDAERDYYNIESIALDSNNSNVLYVAAGRESTGEILKSVDQGKTWSPTYLRTPEGDRVWMGGNEPWRWAGERLVVDPNNSQVIYFGSRRDGLYRSADGAQTWQKVANFPDDAVEGGITFILFDPNSASVTESSAPSSQTIFAGLMGLGVYKSQDGGSTWELLTDETGTTRTPQQAFLASDGTLFVTFFASGRLSPGGVWKYVRSQWLDITPFSGKSYTAITGSASEPNVVMVAEYPLSPEGMYRSTDGGQTWDVIRLRTQTPNWWPDWHLYTLMGALKIDPHNSNRVWLTTGFGIMRTEDITKTPSDWIAQMANLEEFVVLTLKSLPVSNESVLLSGMADMDGFRHTSLTTVPTQTHDKGVFGDTTGIDFSETSPNFVVRVGSSPGLGGREDSQVRAASSSDGGQTWQPFAEPPAGAVNGKVAVSATLQPNGKPIIVWAPQGYVYPHRSLDGGQTWLPVDGAPNGTTLQLWFSSQAIASDRVDGNTFYLYKYADPQGGSFYRSVDGGETWGQTVTGLPDHWIHSVKAMPGKQGEVWLNVYGSLLYRSSNAGQTFTTLANVQQMEQFAFGKAAPGRENPTLFVLGVVNSTYGLFRSDNATALSGSAPDATWVNVASEKYALGNITYLEGDRQHYGVVYAGTGGRGIFYGSPARLACEGIHSAVGVFDYDLSSISP